MRAGCDEVLGFQADAMTAGEVEEPFMPLGRDSARSGPMLHRALTLAEEGRQCGLTTETFDYLFCIAHGGG